MREDFPLLRASLAAPYSELDGEALGELVESLYGPGATPEDVENFFKNIGRGFKKAAGAVGGFAKTALPGVVSGAMTGASVGGPWGALIGAVAGGAGSALSKSKSKVGRQIGGAIGGVGSLVSTVRGGGGAAGGLSGILSKVGGGAGGGAGGAVGNILSAVRGGGATGALGPLAAVGLGGLNGIRPPGIAAEPGGGGANALMSLLGRPEMARALMSSALGAYGNNAVAVGGQQIPVQDMLSALSGLAGQAAQEAAEHDESTESVPAYVAWAEAEFEIDADAAEGRRDAVLLALALAPNLWAGQNRPVVVNVTSPEPGGTLIGDREAAFWAEFEESDESDESDEAWGAGEAWQDGEDIEAWASGEAGWDEEESAYAWQ